MRSNPAAGRAACEEIARTCALFNLRKVSRAVSQIYEGLIGPSGITGPQFSALVAMSTRDEWTLTRLAEALTVDRTTMTRNLALMEKEGLVAIAAGPDRRERVISVTPKGRDSLARALPLWRRAQGRLARALGAQRLRRLVKILASASESLAGE